MKSQFADGYYEHRKAGGTLHNFKPMRLLVEALGASSEVVMPQAYPAAYPSLSLSPTPTFQNQINNYYCGPASAWVAMTYKGIGNNHFGAPLTQPNLGTWYWLETDVGQQTPRGENWRKTLNGWVDGTNDGWYVASNIGSVDPPLVASRFSIDIEVNYAPIMNVFMTVSRGFLPSWEGDGYDNVAHYVPGYGYAQYGDFLHYIEVFGPVGSGYYTNVTKEKFAQLVAGYGMIW